MGKKPAAKAATMKPKKVAKSSHSLEYVRKKAPGFTNRGFSICDNFVTEVFNYS